MIREALYVLKNSLYGVAFVICLLAFFIVIRIIDQPSFDWETFTVFTFTWLIALIICDKYL